jgi:hypothetical protein
MLELANKTPAVARVGNEEYVDAVLCEPIEPSLDLGAQDRNFAGFLFLCASMRISWGQITMLARYFAPRTRRNSALMSPACARPRSQTSSSLMRQYLRLLMTVGCGKPSLLLRNHRDSVVSQTP